MPSSLGHTLAGLTVASLFSASSGGADWQTVFFANAPDLDLLLGLLSADMGPDAEHGMATHSVGAALLAGGLAGAFERWRGGRFGPRFAQTTTAYASHLYLDYLSKESAMGDGMMLLWPASRRRIASEHVWFRTITSKSRKRGFVLGLFNKNNAGALLREAASLGPVLWLARRIRGCAFAVSGQAMTGQAT